MRSLPILAATAALACALPAQWANLTTLTTFPSSRRLGASAWDATANRLIFYGGLVGSPAQIAAQTWSFNGTWTQLSPAGGSIGRWGHRMVRNTQNNRLVTFGGRSPTISGFANDTQEWTGSAWTTVLTPTAPSARYHYGLAFDQARNVVVLFGGRTSTTTLADTWEYNGSTWVQRTTATTPPARQEMVMVYDPGIGRTVMFGGFDDNTDTVLGDTWHYDGTDWEPRTPDNSPSARYASHAIHDSTRQRIVLYGGYTGTALVRDTYEYTGETWNTVATATVPTAAVDALHGYDPLRRKFVLFGGYGGTFPTETWEYTGANTGFSAEFGEGTQTSVGEPTIESNAPQIGQPWNVTFGNMPANQEFVLVATGTSNTTFNGIPLPLDLGLIGLPGAQLLVAPTITNIVLTVASGTTSTAAFTTPIPNSTAVINFAIFAQGLLLDFDTASFAFIGATAGLRAVVGGP